MRTAYLIAGSLLLGLVFFAVATIRQPLLTLLGACGVGFASFMSWRALDAHESSSRNGTYSILMAALASLVGALLTWAVSPSPTEPWAWLGIGLAMVTAGGIWALSKKDGGPSCFVCRLPLERAASFVCPRCRQTVCARPSCWNGRHLRCRYCLDREVVVFPLDERWWRTQLGPRVMKGECTSCYKEAQETDLRECRQCHWSTCKRCWDYHNGRCLHCDWVIRNLPRQLRLFIRPRGEHHAAR